jgi:hypothetical protein
MPVGGVSMQRPARQNGLDQCGDLHSDFVLSRLAHLISVGRFATVTAPKISLE